MYTINIDKNRIGGIAMRIAVIGNRNKISEQMGKSVEFTIFEIFPGQLKGKMIVSGSMGGGQEALIYVLKNEGAEVLLCGEVSEVIKTELEKYGIQVISGLKGNVHSLIRAYAKGNFKKHHK